jgi:hypothetical protein
MNFTNQIVSFNGRIRFSGAVCRCGEKTSVSNPDPYRCAGFGSAIFLIEINPNQLPSNRVTPTCFLDKIFFS